MICRGLGYLDGAIVRLAAPCRAWAPLRPYVGIPIILSQNWSEVRNEYRALLRAAASGGVAAMLARRGALVLADRFGASSRDWGLPAGGGTG